MIIDTIIIGVIAIGGYKLIKEKETRQKIKDKKDATINFVKEKYEKMKIKIKQNVNNW